MIPVNGSSFGRAGGRLCRYPGGTENASILGTVRGSMPNWPIASTGGTARRENWEHADMAQSLRHSRRVEGFRDAASENSGCEVASQVLGSLPVTSSRPFIGEPR